METTRTAPSLVRGRNVLFAAGLAFLVAVLFAACEPPRPTLGVGDVAVLEANGGALVTVTLSAKANAPVSATYSFGDGTAIAPSDYTRSTGSITIPTGQTKASFFVAVVPDRRDEADEVFNAGLEAVSGATLGDAVGNVTILDDDEPPTISLAPGELEIPEAEAGSSGTVTRSVTVGLSDASQFPVSARLRTVDGADTRWGIARAGEDYEPFDVVVEVPPGSTSVRVPVTVKGDVLHEGSESPSGHGDELFGITMTEVRNARPLAQTFTHVTIVEDDPQPSITISDDSMTEANGTLSFVVRLSTPSGRLVTTSWATADATAEAGSDYTAGAGSIRFEPGQTTATLTVPVFEDDCREAREELSVQLTDVANAIVADARGRGTIIDDRDALDC